MKGIAFKDRVLIHVYAGNGGDGCASFRREKYVDKGGPDGGDGGRGGSVLVQADTDVDSLVSLYYQPLQRAQHGGRGKGAQRTGESGDDLIVRVPCGTVIWEVAGVEPHPPATADFDEPPAKSNPFDAERTYVGEVVKEGDSQLVAQGGRGGKGNLHFVSSTHQAPTEFTKGTPGEIKALILELKTVADIGLVGYPNAGKSTLLSVISHAHPKIAPYPFTTVNPLIGTVTFDDYTSIRVADIPGLIDGAHLGVGLGYEFLRHVERSTLLLFVLDMAGVDGRHPADDYKKLRHELKLYSEELEKRPFLIVANKMDLPEAKEHLAEFIKQTGLRPFCISAASKEGVEELKQALYEWKRGLRTFDQ